MSSSPHSEPKPRQKSTTIEILEDNFAGRFRRSSRQLCHPCNRIPFLEYLKDSSAPQGEQAITTRKPQTYCLSLLTILSNRRFCDFCQLLFCTVSREEYDLLRADHIAKHLGSSDKLKEIKTFKKWSEVFSNWENKLNGEEIWPFGYSRDQKDAQEDAESVAQKLFNTAENKDLESGTLNGMYKTTDDLSTALRSVALTTGVVDLFDTPKAFAGAQLLTSQMAMHEIGKARRLPCLFIIRAYERDAAKAGVLSVRTFAHGRAFHAPLKEINHFSFRLDQPQPTPRAQGQQLWYGRMLKPHIDVAFFKSCLKACQKLHAGTCDKFAWRSHLTTDIPNTFVFRLIDVKHMRVVPMSFPPHRTGPDGAEPVSYVALSYRWGRSTWNKPADNEAIQNRRDHLGSRVRASTADLVERVELTRFNAESLRRAGALRDVLVRIPQTIRDAIIVCQRMDEQYLWVDSLCIIQDESDPENKSNVAHMSAIYGEASFTIVAAHEPNPHKPNPDEPNPDESNNDKLDPDKPDANKGIVGVNKQRALPDQVTGTILGNINLFLPIDMTQNLKAWESRAWTFQEKLLSRRMLVFCNGFAVWHCRGATWREDVNALDGNCQTTSFPWLQLEPVPETEGSLQSSGLELTETDESIRLMRLPAFHQFAKVIEDFSSRAVSESWRILDAFKGLQKVLESPYILNSEFRFGIPTLYMDAGLLWQPDGAVVRRAGEVDRNDVVLQESPPSWSWAGWESKCGVPRAKITFDIPYEVEADVKGLLMRVTLHPELIGEERMNPTDFGEERMRPLHGTIYGLADSTSHIGHRGNRLVDLGLLNQRNTLHQIPADWTSSQRKAEEPPEIQLDNLTQRHIVFNTEAASLWLIQDVFRVRRRTKLAGIEYVRETLEDKKPSPSPLNQAEPDMEQILSVSEERAIKDPGTSKRVGTMKLNSGEKFEGTVHLKGPVSGEGSKGTGRPMGLNSGEAFRSTGRPMGLNSGEVFRSTGRPMGLNSGEMFRGSGRPTELKSGKDFKSAGRFTKVKAIVLSEAQYMGDEKRVDVVGYPILNIMAIRQNERGFSERIGLGRIEKRAWKKTNPKKEVIILE